MDDEEDLDEETVSSEDTIDEADYAGDDKEGWIKLSRKDSWVWHYSPALTAVWIYLLRNANYKDGWYKHAYKIKRGQRVTSYGRLSRLCKISYDQARTCIKKLKDHGSIIPTLLPDQKLLITICNYESYQGFGSTRSQPKSQPDPNLIPTIREYNQKDKKDQEREEQQAGEPPAPPSAPASPPPTSSPTVAPSPDGSHPEAVVPQKSPDDEVPPPPRYKHKQTHISQAPKWALPFIAAYSETRNGDSWYEWRKSGCGGIFQELVQKHGEIKVLRHFRNALTYPDFHFKVQPFIFSQEFSRFEAPYEKKLTPAERRHQLEAKELAKSVW